MTEYYLSDALASGTGTGLSRSDPFNRTQINAKGAGFFAAGDRLLVRPEAYAGNLYFALQGGTGDSDDYFYVLRDQGAGTAANVRPSFSSDGTIQPTMLASVVNFLSCGHVWCEGLEADAAYALDTSDLAPSLSCFNFSNPSAKAMRFVIMGCSATRAGFQGISYGYASNANASGTPFVCARNTIVGSGDNGIATYGYCDGPRIVDNYISTVGRGAAALGYVFGGDGISIHESTKNAVIARNRIDGCINGIHNIPILSATGVIFGNYITDCTGTAVILEDWEGSAGTGVPVQQDWYVIANTICGAGAAASWDASCLSIGHNTQRSGEPNTAVGGLFNAYVRNNIFWDKSGDNYAIFFGASDQAGNTSNTIELRNNIIVANSGKNLHYKRVSRLHTLNFNQNRYATQAAGLWRRTVSGVGTNYDTLAAWQALGGTYDPSSTVGATGLVGDPSTAYQNGFITSASACKGAGATATDSSNSNVWGYDNLDGRGRRRPTTWDIGPTQQILDVRRGGSARDLSMG